MQKTCSKLKLYFNVFIVLPVLCVLQNYIFLDAHLCCAWVFSPHTCILSLTPVPWDSISPCCLWKNNNGHMQDEREHGNIFFKKRKTKRNDTMIPLKLHGLVQSTLILTGFLIEFVSAHILYTTLIQNKGTYLSVQSSSVFFQPV